MCKDPEAGPNDVFEEGRSVRMIGPEIVRGNILQNKVRESGRS